MFRTSLLSMGVACLNKLHQATVYCVFCNDSTYTPSLFLFTTFITRPCPTIQQLVVHDEALDTGKTAMMRLDGLRTSKHLYGLGWYLLHSQHNTKNALRLVRVLSANNSYLHTSFVM